MFFRFDPIFRNLTGGESTADPDGLREALIRDGVSFVEIPVGLPSDKNFEDVYVNDDLQLASRQALPASCCPDDVYSEVETSVPDLSGCPPGLVVEPAAGSPVGSGVTQVRVRAPGYHDHFYTIEVHTEQDAKNVLIAHAKSIRYNKEMAGAVFEGHPVATDDRSKILTIGSVLAAQMDPSWKTMWDCSDGSEIEISAANIVQFSQLVLGHVGRLFDKFNGIQARINSGEITTLEEVEAEFSQ